MPTMKEALKAKKRMQKRLNGISGISGVGITWDEDGEPCIRVNVDFNIEKVSRNKIPPYIGKVKVKVESVDNIKLEQY